MDFSDTFFRLILPTGAFSALVGGLVSHFFESRRDIQKRTMEIRKDLYTRVIEQLSFFVSTVSHVESEVARKDLLRYFREIQMWGSDEVVRSFKRLMDSMVPGADVPGKERDLNYKFFIIAMRHDILGRTDLAPEEIDIRPR
jgi:hypothetical protein